MRLIIGDGPDLQYSRAKQRNRVFREQSPDADEQVLSIMGVVVSAVASFPPIAVTLLTGSLLVTLEHDDMRRHMNAGRIRLLELLCYQYLYIESEDPQPSERQGLTTS